MTQLMSRHTLHIQFVVQRRAQTPCEITVVKLNVNLVDCAWFSAGGASPDVGFCRCTRGPRYQRRVNPTDATELTKISPQQIFVETTPSRVAVG